MKGARRRLVVTSLGPVNDNHTIGPDPTVRARVRAAAASSDLVRIGHGALTSVRDSLRHRRAVTTRWVPGEARWHYRWPEGRVVDEGHWRDAAGWATHGFYYEMADLLWGHYRPRQGDVVIDVGAGHGGETLFLAGMVGPTGVVIAVEAAPEPFARLSELVRINDWGHVTPVQAAVTDHPGEVTISVAGADWIAGNIFDPGVGVTVPGRTLDELCETFGIDEVDWVKLNIEGAEKEALRGMERMAPHVRNLTISCHDFLGTEWGRSFDVVTAWLTDHGFKFERRDDPDEVFGLYVYAWR